MSIKIIPAQLSWPAEFQTIARQLREVLGDLAVRIDHIGSTAVAELPAKDIIDIQITVADLQNPKIYQRLIAVGYNNRSEITRDNLVGVAEDSKQLQKRYFTERSGERATHIHIREVGRLNQQYPLLFRDYLQENESARLAYATIKKELAKRFPNDSEAYYAIKDPYMDTLYQAALLWAKQ